MIRIGRNRSLQASGREKEPLVTKMAGIGHGNHLEGRTGLWLPGQQESDITGREKEEGRKRR